MAKASRITPRDFSPRVSGTFFIAPTLPVLDADVVLLRDALPVQPPPAFQALVFEDHRRQITVGDTADQAGAAVKEEGPEDGVTYWVHFTSEWIGNAGVNRRPYVPDHFLRCHSSLQGHDPSVVTQGDLRTIS